MSTWQDHCVPRYLVRHYFWMCLWAWFWEEMCRLSQAVGIPNVDSNIQFIEGLKRRKKVETVRMPSLSPLGCLLPAALCTLGLGLQPQTGTISLDLWLSGPWEHHWLSWSSSLQMAGLGSLHMPVSYNEFKCIYTENYSIESTNPWDRLPAFSPSSVKVELCATERGRRDKPFVSLGALLTGTRSLTSLLEAGRERAQGNYVSSLEGLTFWLIGAALLVCLLL